MDTSDHEVNIKILLDKVVADGDLTPKERNELLGQMTDEVGALVLQHNYDQNVALSSAVAQAAPLLHVHADWIRRLERAGLLNRVLEALPTAKQMQERRAEGKGLTAPELAVLMAYTKIALAAELLDSDVPEDPFLRCDLVDYFPTPMRDRYAAQMEQHPLRREITVTQIVNDLVNGAGVTFFHRLSGETGATASELARANLVARKLFDVAAVWRSIDELDNKIDARTQTSMRLVSRTLVERASRWLVNNRRPRLESEATLEHFGSDVAHVVSLLPELLLGREAEAFAARRDRLIEQAVPEDLAARVAAMPPAYAALGIVETARRRGDDPGEVARVHFALGDRLGLDRLVDRILALPRNDRWQTMARAALRDDLHAVHAQLTGQVLGTTDPDQPAEKRIVEWEQQAGAVNSRALGTLDEICADDSADLARLSVGLRVVRTLLGSP